MIATLCDTAVPALLLLLPWCTSSQRFCKAAGCAWQGLVFHCQVHCQAFCDRFAEHACHIISRLEYQSVYTWHTWLSRTGNCEFATLVCPQCELYRVTAHCLMACRGLIQATLHLVNREFDALADDFVTLGLLPAGSDKTEITPALTGVFQDALANGVNNLNFGDLSGNLGQTMYQYNFRIPPYYTLLVRSLSVLEVSQPECAPKLWYLVCCAVLCCAVLCCAVLCIVQHTTDQFRAPVLVVTAFLSCMATHPWLGVTELDSHFSYCRVYYGHNITQHTHCLSPILCPIFTNFHCFVHADTTCVYSLLSRVVAPDLLRTLTLYM